jgi:transposase
MSFRVEQKVGKHIYLYEVESYWDKEKKQPRQKRTYLGKKDPQTGELVSTQRGYRSLDYGPFYFLNEISKKTDVQLLLKQVFPDTWAEILHCVFFEISEKKPLYLCKPWLECTYHEPRMDLSSQRISELLHELGRQERERFAFLKTWAKIHQDSEYIVFDITSFSSYAKKLEGLEWGYNRDGESLPQINLGVLYGEPSSLPLFYTVYPGSIPDVRTLQNMVQMLEWLELSKALFVLDRGFFSSYNLKSMNERMRFVIPFSFSNKKALELIKKHKRNLSDHSNAFRLNKQLLYCVRDRVQIGEKRYSCYVYQNEKLRAEERERFLSQVLDIEQKLKEPAFANKQDIETFLSETLRGWKTMFQITEKEGKVTIKRNEKGITDRLERMGTMILLSNRTMDGKEILHLYRRKDAVEKFFDAIKHELERKRLRIHTQETFEGRLFLDFVALILYAWISNVMRREGINKVLSVQELMYELKKIKLIHLGEKKTVITEVSKRQRDLFQAFKIELPRQT